MITAQRHRHHFVFAMIVGYNGQTMTKCFPNRRSAMTWLEGEGAAKSKGRIERIELYNWRNKLIWSKPSA